MKVNSSAPPRSSVTTVPRGSRSTEVGLRIVAVRLRSGSDGLAVVDLSSGVARFPKFSAPPRLARGRIRPLASAGPGRGGQAAPAAAVSPASPPDTPTAGCLGDIAL